MNTTASHVVAALAMPPLRTQPTERLQPLPLTELHRLPRDASTLYGIGRVDASGRISERHIIRALGWRPGQQIDIGLIRLGMVIRASADGPITLTQTARLVIPLIARRHCQVDAGDHLLLAAAPEHGVIIVHTAAALDDMLVRYHAAARSTDRHERP